MWGTGFWKIARLSTKLVYKNLWVLLKKVPFVVIFGQISHLTHISQDIMTSEVMVNLDGSRYGQKWRRYIMIWWYSSFQLLPSTDVYFPYKPWSMELSWASRQFVLLMTTRLWRISVTISDDKQNTVIFVCVQLFILQSIYILREVIYCQFWLSN